MNTLAIHKSKHPKVRRSKSPKARKSRKSKSPMVRRSRKSKARKSKSPSARRSRKSKTRAPARVKTPKVRRSRKSKTRSPARVKARAPVRVKTRSARKSPKVKRSKARSARKSPKVRRSRKSKSPKSPKVRKSKARSALRVKSPLLRVKPLTKSPESYLISIKPYFVRAHGHNKDVPSDAEIKKFIQTDAVRAIEDIIKYGPVSNSEACDFSYNSAIGTLHFKLPGILPEKQVRDYIVKLRNTPLEHTEYGLGVACKSDPKKECGFIDYRDDIRLTVLYPKRSSTKRSYNLVHDILNRLGYNFTLDARAEAYFDKLLKKLIPKLDDEEFLTGLENLGHLVKEDADRSAYTDDNLPGVSGVYTSNILLSICNELLDLVKHGLRDKRKCTLTADFLEKVIKDDVELSAAFLGTKIE